MAIPSTWTDSADHTSATFTDASGTVFTVSGAIYQDITADANWEGGDPLEDAMKNPDGTESQLFTHMELVVATDGTTVTIGDIGTQLLKAETDLETATAALTQAQSDLAAAQAENTSLQAQITQLQAEVAALQAGTPPADDDSGLAARVTALEAQVATNTTDIAALQSGEVGESVGGPSEADFQALQAQVAANTAALTALATEVGGEAAAIVQDIITAMTNEETALNPPPIVPPVSPASVPAASAPGVTVLTPNPGPAPADAKPLL